MSRSLVPALAVSALLGAVVAVGAVELFDLGGGKTSTTTVVRGLRGLSVPDLIV